MSTLPTDKVAEFFNDREKMANAMGEAVRKTLRTHKLLGFPIVIWRDGKVVWVPPEEIEIPDEKNGQSEHT